MKNENICREAGNGLALSNKESFFKLCLARQKKAQRGRVDLYEERRHENCIDCAIGKKIAAGGKMLPANVTVKEMTAEIPKEATGKSVHRKKSWTGEECRILRENYPAGGTGACLPLLTGRSAAAITVQAHLLHIKYDRKGKPCKRPEVRRALLHLL